MFNLHIHTHGKEKEKKNKSGKAFRTKYSQIQPDSVSSRQQKLVLLCAITRTDTQTLCTKGK